jgi:hypothetical protein
VLKTSIEYAQGKGLQAFMFREHAPPAKNIFIPPIESISSIDQSEVSIKVPKPIKTTIEPFKEDKTFVL